MRQHTRCIPTAILLSAGFRMLSARRMRNSRLTIESTIIPGNATLVLTGDFETDRVLDKVFAAVLCDSAKSGFRRR